ncbi:MAG: hypothetical protein ACON39_06965 [Coraliomargaritaceae bacterium]
MSERPLVYVLFGIPESGRREVLYDLIEGGLEKGTNVLYFKPKQELPSLADEKLLSIRTVTTANWELDGARLLHSKIEAAPDVLFFLAPGRADPADVVESIKTWADKNDCEVARLLTVVHCSFLKDNPEAKAWFDACIHFSDIVLLNHRNKEDNKWIRQFEAGYAKQHNPSRFLLVKNNRVANPAEVLYPEARRSSLYFDDLIPIEEDEFEEDAPDDLKPDRYIERLESGQRAYPIPSIAKWLS